MSNQTHIRSDYCGTQGHQTKALNELFTIKVHTCSSPARQRPFSASEALPIVSIIFCAPSPVKQTPSPSLACGLSRPVRKLGDDFPAEEVEEEVEEEENEVSSRYITSQSLREARWTSQGGVRISTASRDTCPSQ